MNVAARELGGFINIDKESGYSSHDVVSVIRRLFNCRARGLKVGHTGTLDPMATGVLPICLGKATRLAEYITDCQKSYRASIIFGIATDSYDAEGEVSEKCSAAHLKEEDVTALFSHFQGEIEQVPPMVSALKHQGQALYKLARQGQEIERAARRVTIYDFQYLGGNFGSENPTIEIEVTCSRGTYIRSIAHDLGALTGTCAHLSALRRTEVGPFKIAEAHTLDEVEKLAALGNLDFISPLTYGIEHLPTLIVSAKEAAHLVHGIALAYEGADVSVAKVIDSEDRLIGIAQLKGAVLTMNKVLMNTEILGAKNV